jgi:phage shock protein A
MGLFDRISRVVRSNVNAAVSAAEDPEKILEQAVIDMQDQLVKLRQAVATSMASLKRLEQQLGDAQKQANEWQARAELAMRKGDEGLAREALTRKKSFVDTVNALTPQVQQQKTNVDNLKRQLAALEGKIAEAKTKKDVLKARAQSAKAQEQVQKTLNDINPTSALSAFDKMEEKVLQAEARAQAQGELSGISGLEEQFAALDSSVDDELAKLKASVSGGALPPASSPAADSLRQAADSLDDELAKLRQENNQ